MASPIVYDFDISSKSTTPFVNNIVTRCFGSSHAATALTADWQNQLRKVHDEIGTEYVRFHGLLDDDMSVVIPRRNIPRKPGFSSSAQDPDKNHAKNQTCTFLPHRDYYDPAGPVLNATTQQECCELCYHTPTGLPEPCVVAVWTPDNKCYTKLSTLHPVDKPTQGVVSCLTDRPSPKGFMFSFVNIFRVFDFLVSIGMRPVVEVGFMPSLLASDPDETGFWYKGGHSPPKDFADWNNLITTLTHALIERYGLEEVQQWYFEVWNEPNCGFYDAEQNCCGPTCGNHSAYLELFLNTFGAIKKAEPSLRVGGPATAQLGWLNTFLTNSVKHGITPDFLSSHLYPTDPYIPHTREGMSNAFVDAANNVSATARHLGLSHPPPLLITEFNCGLGIKCADAPYAASFIAHAALTAQQTVGQIVFQSYWTFSDIFEEQGQQPSEFSQAFGAQSIHGIAKPVYRSMQLINRLHPRQLTLHPPPNSPSSLDVTVTVPESKLQGDEKGGVAEVMLTNHVGGPSAEATAINSAQIQGYGHPEGDPNALNVTLRVTGCTNTPRVELRRVDLNHANALKLYYNIGAPPYPNATTLQKLRVASEIAVESVTPTKDGGGDFWDIHVPTLPSFAVASVAIEC